MVRMIGTQGQEKVLLYDLPCAEKVKQEWEKEYPKFGWKLNQIRPKGSELESVIDD